MKLWLLDILACPIEGCKSYPLKLKIFTWETEKKAFQKANDDLEKKDPAFLKKELKNRITISQSESKPSIEDEMTKEPVPLEEYLKIFSEKLDILKTIEDLSESPSAQLLKKALDMKKKLPSTLTPELNTYIYVLNWILYRAEVEEGIILCDKCGRWYPIIETIPHMLPDDLREEKEDKTFLEKWKNKIPKKVLDQGKPFNLK
ncbi:MAG: Trm112 family protein [Candidatus Freyrarchaeum guaymaensis]|nr:Trm112 family protein [Candidatus Sigynarchaeota archaeon]